MGRYRVEFEVEVENEVGGEDGKGKEERRKWRVTLHLAGREDLDLGLGLGEVLARDGPGEMGSAL